MKKLMKKALIWSASLILLFPFIASAINITVPSASSSGYILVSTSTGAYITVASSSLPYQSPISFPLVLNLGGTGLSTSTPGDLIVGTSSTNIYSRLAIGPPGNLLQSSSTSPYKMAWVSTTTLGISGGGSTSPGGSSGDIQFNNSGSFGGETLVPLANGGTALANTITTLTTNGTITAMPVATSIIRYNNGSTVTIEGIATTTGSQRIILQASFSSVGLTLKNQNTGAATTTRLELQNNQDLALPSGTQVELFYNTVDQRWEMSNFRSPVGITNGLTTQNIFSNAGGIPTGVGDIVFGNNAVGAGTFNGSNAIILGTGAAQFGGNANNLIAIGNGACADSGTGSNGNICIGAGSFASSTSASENVGVGSMATNDTTGNENVGIGDSDFSALTTGNQNEAFGFDAGGTNVTGSDNISIGAGTQSGSSNLSNTIGIGTAVRPTLSNTADIGGTSDPLDVGIDNDAAAYPLDVNGNINTNGAYLVNGVAQTPWTLVGNSGTSPGTDFVGTTDATDLYFDTNSTPIEIIKSTGLTGFQQTNPGAIVDAGILPVTVGSPASSFPGLIFATPGYSFGSGNKNYSIYGYTTIDGSRIYSASPNNFTFSEPSYTTYDPSGGSASFTGGSGYTASGYDFSYTIWALYGGQTMISVDSANVSDTGSDPNDGSQYDVSASWGAPAGSPAPDAYLVQINGSNPNSGQYQVVSGTSFTDTNSGWGSSASYSALTYQMQVSYTSGSGASGYRILNTSATTYFDDTTPTQTVIDDSTWASGSTVTPTTGSYPSLISEGTTELVTNGTGNLGFFNTSPVTQQTGDIGTALENYGLLTSPSLNANDLLYGGTSSMFGGDTFLYPDGSTFGDMNAHSFNFGAGATISSSGIGSFNTINIGSPIPSSSSVTGMIFRDSSGGGLGFNDGSVHSILLDAVQLSGFGQVLGVLQVNNGGTGFSTYAKGDMLFALSTTSLAKLAIGSTGQVMSVSSAGLPSWSTFSGPCGTPTDQLNLTAATSSLATCTPTATTTLMVSPYLTVNSIATDVEQVQVVYTDETNTSRTQTLLTTSGLSSISTTGAYMFAPVSIRVKANSAVTVSTVLTTSIGSISYDAGASLKYDR